MLFGGRLRRLEGCEECWGEEVDRCRVRNAEEGWNTWEGENAGERVDTWERKDAWTGENTWEGENTDTWEIVCMFICIFRASYHPR